MLFAQQLPSDPPSRWSVLMPRCGLSVYDEDEESTGICYGLFGVVEHRGSLSGGHYTAYVRVGGLLCLWCGRFVWVSATHCIVPHLSAGHVKAAGARAVVAVVVHQRHARLDRARVARAQLRGLSPVL